MRCGSCGAEVPADARFCPSCGAAVAVPPTAAPAVPGADELRPVTALFADIVGSTALGERLGPDEVKALVGECVSRMSRAVEEFGGVIQAYMGDGICAYFGVPSAHEDDPERAAQAALRILRVVGEYAREVEGAWGITEFNVRVGVNSGQTAVGEVGAGAPQTVALGDATNVAARLESAAFPGTIVVGESCARRLAPSFLLEPLGDLGVKGRAGTVTAWNLIGVRTAHEAPAATPLVGRDAEMGRLGSAMGDLVAGRGQALLLVGETGMGKTRMLAELRRMASDEVTWVDARCSSYGADLSYRPFVDLMRTWLGAEQDEAEIAVRAKLRARVSALMGSGAEEVLPFLGLLLSVRLEPDRERDLLSLSAGELAGRMRAAYVAWLEALAAQRPVTIAIDDVHWADASTCRLAEDLLELTDRAPLLVAVALRPDPASEGWRLRLKVLADYAHRATEIPLPPLAPEAAGALVDALMPGGLLDEALKAEVISRAEGNPLYVEELLRALLEAGGADRRRTWTISAGAAADLPPALEGLLVARIDRLPTGAGRLAQVAAAVGREFPVRVLERVEGGDVSADLGLLLRAEIVRELRRYPELECTFRHGLLQEAALSTLTPPALRELYGRVGLAFEELYAGSIDERLDRLAFYFYRSDEHGKALAYLERAAERATEPAHETELLGRAKKVAARTGDAEAEARIDGLLAELEKPPS